MKRKTLYNTLMFAAIVLSVAAAVFLTGHHLGWFEKAQQADSPAITAEVGRGLATLTRDGLATGLKSETVLRAGDTLTVASGYVQLTAGDSTLLLGEGGTLEVTNPAADAAAVTLTAGELFCAAADTAVTLRYDTHTAALSGCVAACSVRSGAQTLYMLSGSVTDGTNVTKSGSQCSYAGSDCAVSALQLQALSTYLLECALGCGRTLCFSPQELQDTLSGRGGVTEAISAATEGDTCAEAEEQGQTAHTSEQTSDSAAADSEKKQPTEKPSADQNTTTEQKDDPLPAEEQSLTCTVEIRCDTILDHMSDLSAGLDVYVPKSGTILPATTVSFTGGETVYDVLRRVCDQKGIQLEASYTPLYEAYYVEGIHHLYAFDCGSESGWMYKVDGWFPNYGCSSYELKGGEQIVWCYTCQYGDVGGSMG